jgi:ribonuclease-3
LPHTEPNTLTNLQHSLGVRFENTALLEQALTHRSYLNEHPGDGFEDYERLEYLGDAFLGWVIADELYRRHPGFTEGDLTRGRAALVRGSTLADIARSFDAGAYLTMGSGEETSGGRERRDTLAAVVEALIGAVLLDKGEREAHELVLRWLGTKIDALDPAGTPRDAKSALQESYQRTGKPIPVYELVREDGPSHDKTFEVRVLIDGQELGRGEGRRKVDAEQTAAAQALNAAGSTHDSP